MSDWREIIAHEYEDGYGYRIFHDDSYDSGDYERGFKVYGTLGAAKYIEVDVSISAQNADEENHIQALLKNAKAFRPLYMYVHSGVSVRTEPFGDPWDSGQCGFAVLEKDSDIEGDAAHLENVIDMMVREYDNVLRGNVVAWQITKMSKCSECKQSTSYDIIDGCGGYIGFDYKELDSLVDEVMETIKKHREAEHASTATAVGND